MLIIALNGYRKYTITHKKKYIFSFLKGIRRKIKVRKSSAPQSRSQSHDSMDRVYSIEHSGQSSAKTSILTTASVATARFRGTGISLSGSTDSRSSLVKMGIYGGGNYMYNYCG